MLYSYSAFWVQQALIKGYIRDDMTVAQIKAGINRAIEDNPSVPLPPVRRDTERFSKLYPENPVIAELINS